MTLYDTINLIEQIALQQPNVRTAKEGNVFDHLNANPSVQYAAVILTQGLHQQDEQFNHFRFSIFYVDRLEADLDSNRIQIQSTGKEVLNNIIRTLISKFDAECDDITYQPFTQRFADECAGVFASVVIDVPVDYLCAEDYGDSDWVSGRVVIRNQIKAIDITSNGHYDVTYDQGYTGLENVAIEVNVSTGSTINNQDKKVSLSLSTATISSSVTADVGYTGLGKVEIEADASLYGQSQYESGHSAGYDEGYESGYTEGQASVHCNLQHKNVTVTGATMTISPDGGYDGMSEVDLDASDYALAKEQEGRQEAIASLESKTITSNGTYSASTDSAIGWSSVTVNVEQQHELQEKRVEIADDITEVTPDVGYYGLSSVSVDATAYGQNRYEEGKESIKIQERKTIRYDIDYHTVIEEINPDPGYDAIEKVTISIDVNDFGNKRYNDGRTAQRNDTAESASAVTYSTNGTFYAAINEDTGEGYISAVTVSVPTGSTCNLQSKSVTYADNGTFQVAPDAGYDGMSSVLVEVNVPQTTGGTLQIQDGTRMSGSDFERIPSGYDFSQVKKFGMMFSNATNLQSVSEGDIDTSSGISFSSMFSGCTSLTSVSGLDTSGALDITGLVCRCTSLTSLGELDASSLPSPELGIFWPNNSEYPNLTDAGGLKNLKISIEDYNWDLCPNLTLQSCINILNGLYDFTGHGEQPGEGQGKLKVHPNFITTVGEQISIATNKGWQVSA